MLEVSQPSKEEAQTTDFFVSRLTGARGKSTVQRRAQTTDLFILKELDARMYYYIIIYVPLKHIYGHHIGPDMSDTLL